MKQFILVEIVKGYTLIQHNQNSALWFVRNTLKVIDNFYHSTLCVVVLSMYRLVCSISEFSCMCSFSCLSTCFAMNFDKQGILLNGRKFLYLSTARSVCFSSLSICVRHYKWNKKCIDYYQDNGQYSIQVFLDKPCLLCGSLSRDKYVTLIKYGGNVYR